MGKNGCKFCANKDERKEIKKKVKAELKASKKKQTLFELEDEEQDPVEVGEKPKKISRKQTPVPQPKKKISKRQLESLIQHLESCEVESDSDEE